MSNSWLAATAPQPVYSYSCRDGGCSAPRLLSQPLLPSLPANRSKIVSATEQPSSRCQTRAAPLTWAFEQEQLSSSSSSDWPGPNASAELALELQQPWHQKPLKINRDLLLYKAKVATAAAIHAPTRAERLQQDGVAEAALRRCLAMDATDGRAYVGLGKVLVSQRRFDEARQLYEEGSMATDGANAHIWQAWATLESRCSNVNYARQLFDAAVTASSSHAAAWHGWGLLEKRQGNLLRARDLWLKGIRKTSDRPNPFLYQSVAVLAGEMGLTSESRKWFEEATRTFTGSGRHGIWQAWAQMEARQGNRDIVRYLLRKGLEAAPRSRYLHLTWALWEKELGQRDNARMLLQRGHSFNRSDPALLQSWGIMEDEDGKIEAARHLFQRATAADPHHVPVWQAWGCMEQRQGNLDRARELFQAGVWAEPGAATVTTVWQAWAVLEVQAGNAKLARQLFKCAVKADPSSVPSWKAWEAFELDQGNVDRAAELEDLQRQGNLQIVWPRNFAAGFAPPSAMSAGNSLDPVFQQVSQWFARFGAKAPSRPQDALPASLRKPAARQASLSEMRKANTSQLELPVASAREQPQEWDTYESVSL